MQEIHKRIIMCVAGVLLSGFAVAMFSFSAFGMDPFQVLAHGLWGLTPLTFGTAYVIVNAVLLVFMFFVRRKMIGLGTLINMFLLGYVVDFIGAFFGRQFPAPSMALRAVFLIAGLILLSLASALYFTADLGVSTYDWIALTISDRGGFPFRNVRILCDLVCVVTGWLLGAAVGIGTLLTAFCMGPIIQFFNETVAEPLRYGRTNS